MRHPHELTFIAARLNNICGGEEAIQSATSFCFFGYEQTFLYGLRWRERRFSPGAVAWQAKCFVRNEQQKGLRRRVKIKDRSHRMNGWGECSGTTYEGDRGISQEKEVEVAISSSFDMDAPSLPIGRPGAVGYPVSVRSGVAPHDASHEP